MVSSLLGNANIFLQQDFKQTFEWGAKATLILNTDFQNIPLFWMFTSSQSLSTLLISVCYYTSAWIYVG